MNIVKKMNCFAAAFMLFSISAIAQKPATRFDMPDINCLEVALPITFSWINFDGPTKDVPDIVEKKIQKIIVDFYLESTGGNSEDVSKAKDYYFQTLRTPLNDLHLYIVILKTPLSYAHCKLFLYNPSSDSVSKSTVDYNTWSMYSIDENNMKRSNLFKDLHLNSDDITVPQKKKSNILLKRIKHNGTFSALEEITYHANGLSLDTVSFKSEVLH